MEGPEHCRKGIRTLFAECPEIILEIVYAFSRTVRKAFSKSFILFRGRSGKFL